MVFNFSRFFLIHKMHCFHGSMSFAHDARTFAMSQMLKVKYDSMMAKSNISRFFPFHCTQSVDCMHEILFTFTQHNYLHTQFFPSTERGAARSLAKAFYESWVQQLTPFDSWTLTVGILLSKVLFFSNKRTRL